MAIRGVFVGIWNVGPPTLDRRTATVRLKYWCVYVLWWIKLNRNMYNIYMVYIQLPNFPTPFHSTILSFYNIYISNKLCHHQVFCSQRREKLREKYLNKAYIHPRLANRTVQLMYSTIQYTYSNWNIVQCSKLDTNIIVILYIFHYPYFYTILASFLLSIFFNYKIC